MPEAALSIMAVGLTPTKMIQRLQIIMFDSWAKSSTLAFTPRSTPRLPIGSFEAHHVAGEREP